MFKLEVVVYLLVLHFQAFSGTQNVSSLQKDEAWRVNVRLQGCDLEHGYLCGTMEALNVPMADTPVRNLSLVHISYIGKQKRKHFSLTGTN